MSYCKNVSTLSLIISLLFILLMALQGYNNIYVAPYQHDTQGNFPLSRFYFIIVLSSSGTQELTSLNPSWRLH